MTTFNVAAGLDDASETFGGSLGDLSNYGEIGTTNTVAGSTTASSRGVSSFRFPNVTIPSGATVTAASFTGNVVGKNDDLNAVIFGHKVANSPQAAALPTIAQTLTFGGTTATSVSSASWTPGANDLLLCFVSLRGATGTRTIGTVTGNGLTWTQIAQLELGGILRGAVFWAQGASPTTGTVTVNAAGSGTLNATACQVLRIPAAELATAEQPAGSTGTSTSPSTTATRSGSRLVIGGCAHRGTGTFSVGSTPDAFTSNTLNYSNGASTSRANISTEYQVVRGASATETFNGTLSGSDTWVMLGVLVKPVLANTPRQRLNDNPTTASTNWVQTDAGLDAPETSPDISTVIQEIIDQGTWASGNALTLLIRGSTTTLGVADIATEEHATLAPASLDVTYSSVTNWSLDATGGSTSSGSADLRVTHSLAASGASTSSGSADLTVSSGPVTHDLAATGASTSTGSAALRLTMPLAATGASTSAGTAVLGVKVPLAASGASTSSGTAVLQLRMALLASGTSASSGTADLTIAGQVTNWSLAASGSSTSSGTAAVTLRVVLSAAGASTTSGTAALGLTLPLSAVGASNSAGTASLVLGVRLSASGASTSLGTAVLSLAHALMATGASVSSGTADLQGGAEVPTLSIVVGDPAAWRVGLGDGWEAGAAAVWIVDAATVGLVAGTALSSWG